MKLAQLISIIQDQGGGLQPGQPGSADLPLDLEISGITCRSQDVGPGFLFVAVRGQAADGHDFIPKAVARGATAVVGEKPAAAGVPLVAAVDARRALAALAAAWYGYPSAHMTLVGITGTNGKTTTSYLVESILQTAGHAVGVVGTINYRYGGKSFDNPVTTPESLDLQRILADMRAAGVTHVVTEVSSHALAQHRVHGCLFDVGVFTNLTQDHLDYHHDMSEYWAAKRKLFEEYLPAAAAVKRPRAVINRRDPRAAGLIAALSLPVVTTGTTGTEDVRAESAEFSLSGIRADLSGPFGRMSIRSPLVGRHNLENILNAVGTAVALEIPPQHIREGVNRLICVPGRLESVPNTRSRFVYVDYSHTPDALENALLALRSLTAERIICVFGCGGDRDRTKRPKMGAIAARLADLAVVTSDNPRSEPPAQITAEIVTGMRGGDMIEYNAADLAEGFTEKGFVVETDRRSAIRLSVRASQSGDTILIAGKGHEPYQIIGGRRLEFDDRREAAAALAG